jgi:Zn-dependent protease with chaperone function
MLRPNPFSFPSDTTIRFLLVVVFVACGSFSLYGNLWSGFHLREDRATTASAFDWLSLILSKAPGLGPIQPESSEENAATAKMLHQSTSSISRLAKSLRAKVEWELGGALLTLSLAALIYLTFPYRKIRREQLRPLDDLEVASELNLLCQKAAVLPYPSFVWNPRKVDFPSAFGFGRNCYIAVSGGFIARFFDADRPVFRAVVLHELAHLRNGDVNKTYFTISLLPAFAAVALLPSIACIFYLRTESSDILLGATTSSLLLILAGLAVLRSREHYADVRASVWDGTCANLERGLATLDGSQTHEWRWPRAFRFHPDSIQRQRTLRDTVNLFRLNFWDAFGVGIALSVSIEVALDLVVALAGPYYFWLIALSGLSYLVLMPLAVGIVGTAVWRDGIASLLTQRRMYNSGRLGVAFAIGFAYRQLDTALHFYARGIFAVIPTKESLHSNAAGYMIVSLALQVIVLSIVLVLIFSWLAACASAWFEVALESPSPRRVMIGSLIVALVSIVISVGATAFITQYFLLVNQQRNAISLYATILTLGLPILFVTVATWLFPFASQLWRKRSASSCISSWAFLEGTRSIACQAPLNLGRSIMIGFIAAIVFGLLEALVQWRSYLPFWMASGISTYLAGFDKALTRKLGENALGFLIVLPSVGLQALAAGAAAAAARRLGFLQGLFAAFIAGVIMVGFDLIMIRVAVNPWTALVFLGGGALAALPVAAVSAAIAVAVRRFTMQNGTGPEPSPAV